MMKKTKIIIQIDCDSEIALSKHYSCNTYECGNEIYFNVLDIFLSLLLQYNMKATFFVVGQDLENEIKCNKLRKLLLAGHEIANHTYSHPNNLSAMPSEEIKNEVLKMNQLCFQKLGCIPLGFRSPNFDINLKILNILNELGFCYDCSMLSTPWKPLLKILKGHNPFTSGYLGANGMFCSMKNPYSPVIKGQKDNYNFNHQTIKEIPITTFPYLKIPCNISYLLALPNNLSPLIFFKLIQWHLNHDHPLILIFHLADLVDNQYLFKTESRFYKSLAKRLFFIENIFKTITDRFESVTTYEYIKNLKEHE